MDDTEEPTNIFKFGAVKGGKEVEEDNSIPENDYIVIDIEDNELESSGFLIFTPHHLAIMRDNGKGAVPVLCLPIGRVKAAVLASDLDDQYEELPF